MDKDIAARRGFISTAAGVGVFVAAGEAFAQARSGIGSTDVLVAMPGDRYYAIPRADLERYSVGSEVFAAEESRRSGESATFAKGAPLSSSGRAPRTVTGVRG